MAPKSSKSWRLHYREELDNIILDISIANSRANSFAVMFSLRDIAGDASWAKQFGQTGVRTDSVNMGMVRGSLDQSIYMGVTWKIFDGGVLLHSQESKDKDPRISIASLMNAIATQLGDFSFAELQPALAADQAPVP